MTKIAGSIVAIISIEAELEAVSLTLSKVTNDIQRPITTKQMSYGSLNSEVVGLKNSQEYITIGCSL